MDIEKWYPRTIPKPSAKVIRTMVEESKVVFVGVDYDKISRYLGEFLDKDEIKSEKLEEIVYTKKKVKRNRKKKGTKKNEKIDKTSKDINDTKDVANKIGKKESINDGKNNTDKASQKDTDDAALGDKEEEIESKEKFDSQLRKPTEVEERKLVGKVVEMLIIAGMTNHVYRFKNRIRIQMNGGPIGLSLTGQVHD